jgi:drug/metabolite transporter (DMT)-like permease
VNPRAEGRLPALIVFGSAAFWGLYWLPQRHLAEAGLTGGWATFGQFALAALFLAPVILWRVLRGRPSGLGPLLPTLLIGGGLVLYANSLLLTSVAHALLLFYLAPAWGTLLELVVQRRSPSAARGAALAMSLAGLWIVVGDAGGFPWPTALGDWCGLIAGITLVFGQFRLRASATGDDLGILFAMLVGGSAMGALFIAIGGDTLGRAPSVAEFAGAWPWLVLITIVFQIAGNVGLIWGASRLDAGRFAILILGDVIVGVASAALLTDEPFGWREAVGWALIVGAGTVEIAARPKASA